MFSLLCEAANHEPKTPELSGWIGAATSSSSRRKNDNPELADLAMDRGQFRQTERKMRRRLSIRSVLRKALAAGYIRNGSLDLVCQARRLSTAGSFNPSDRCDALVRFEAISPNPPLESYCFSRSSIQPFCPVGTSTGRTNFRVAPRPGFCAAQIRPP
jgi:hypothetical protein